MTDEEYLRDSRHRVPSNASNMKIGKRHASFDVLVPSGHVFASKQSGPVAMPN